MFFGDELAFIHCPRSGGTFTRRTLQRHRVGKTSTDIPGHAGARSVSPQVFKDRYVFGTIRGPGEWYEGLSRHYRNRKGGVEGFLLHFIGAGNHRFPHLLQHLTFPTEAMASKPCRYPGSREKQFMLAEELREKRIGLWSWMVMQMFCYGPIERCDPRDLKWAPQTLVVHDHLREGLLQVLGEALPQGPSLELRHHILENKPLNVSKHGGPRFNWTDTMLERIDEADGWLAEPLGMLRPPDERPPLLRVRTPDKTQLALSLEHGRDTG